MIKKHLEVDEDHGLRVYELPDGEGGDVDPKTGRDVDAAGDGAADLKSRNRWDICGLAVNA